MKYLKINSDDNVAVALEALRLGDKLMIEGQEITLTDDIPMGHKFALKNIENNENVIKYGYPIGHTLTKLQPGDWINEKNLKTNLEGVLEYSYQPHPVSLDVEKKDLHFMGYERSNGDVGIRNE